MASLKSICNLRLGRNPFVRANRGRLHYFRELVATLWRTRNKIPYALNIVTHVPCSCHSWEFYQPSLAMLGHLHLCMQRLEALKLNTLPALNPMTLRNVAQLRKFAPDELASLGRLAQPMIRRRKDPGFAPIEWSEAVDVICHSIREAAPHRMAFCAGTQGLTNEAYYVFQKLARALGTNNVDLCVRELTSTGIDGLQATLGIGSQTCSPAAFVGADLVVVFGTDFNKKFPLGSRYLHRLKNAGTQIVVVHAEKIRHWQPSVARGVLFGANLVDDFFQVRSGSEIAFINGALKELIESARLEQEYIDKHTAGFRALRAALARLSWEWLMERSGVSRGEMQRFADLLSQARTAGIILGAGFTQCDYGRDNVKAVVNLALARALLGRERCGIVPIDGLTDTHGAHECGSVADRFPGGLSVNEDTARRFSNLWHHPVPSKPGLRCAPMIESAHRGQVDFLYSLCGDLNEINSDADLVAKALSKVGVRVHQDSVLNPSMLPSAQEAVLLLPCQTRLEQRGGGIVSSPDRRIQFTAEIPSYITSAIGPAWELPAQIGRQAMPNGEKLFPFNNTQSIREEMARVMPIYQGVEKLSRPGDDLQWGGAYLFKDGFTAMPNQRALFTLLKPAGGGIPEVDIKNETARAST